MGAASGKKFIKHNGGLLQEEAALLTSDGAGDAFRIPSLNASGVLDKSIIGGTATSAGAADAGKPLLLDATGRISATAMPVGIGADVARMTASEALAAGDLVNVWNDGGSPKVRKADSTTSGKEAHGFVLSSCSPGQEIDVYFEGTNTQMPGIKAGALYLGTTAGRAVNVPPTASGNVVQRVGFGLGGTSMNFQSGTPVVLA